MLTTIKNMVRESRGTAPGVAFALLLLLLICTAVPAVAWMDVENPVVDMGYNPNGVFILDGSYVMNVGEVQINITNWGLIGSTYSLARPWSDAPSCQWPAGSGEEYLWSSGLWVGGIVLGERLCSTGGFSSEIYPEPDDIEATIYEAIGGRVVRPAGNPDASGNRDPTPGNDDDRDGLIDEEILNGFDDDGDGDIDEDFGQVGNQMFVLTNYDNTRLAQENFPDHTPMNLEIVQTSFQWENDLVDDFVGFDYYITNVGVTNIERVYIGFFSDADIAPRGGGSAGDDMAGSWPAVHGSPGLVRASDGSFVPIQVGYMYDAAENGRLEGYFGIVFLGHDVDPTGRTAPPTVNMRTFQSFSGSTSFDQGGDPQNDDERYQLLSAPTDEWDGNTVNGKEDDFRFLVSAGPFEVMEPGASLSFQVGMVVGPGLGSSTAGTGLLSHCAEAALTWYGIYVNRIPEVTISTTGQIVDPGQYGRETMLCEDQIDNFNTFRPDYMDVSCLDPGWLLNQPALSDSSKFLFPDEDGRERTCAMFNMDNCFECARQLGHLCGPEDFESGLWTCNDPDLIDTAGCTGVKGNETQIHWLVGMAPPPPGLRLWSTDSRVHIFWDDESMITNDIRLQEIDFESYRVWRADNWDRPFGSSEANGPESNLWQMIAEFDLVNNFVNRREIGGTTYLDTIPLGANTGLEVISYLPASLNEPVFAGLMDSMQVLVDGDTDNSDRVRPNVRDSESRPNEYYPLIGSWETYPDVLDTAWAMTSREEDLTIDPPTIGKHGTQYFEYVDRDIHNGFIYFYSTTPGTEAQSAEDREKFGVNIYVYPNPATRDALAEYQELFPNSEDPTGVRVTFTNLPAAVNTIKTYTVSGDLVQEISHDGTDGTGHVSWNLMSRNGQEIVSGVYLYSVQSNDDRLEDFVGKFVVVR